MAQKTRRYAQLLVDTLQDATEKEAREKIAKFRVFLKERGDMKLLNSILQEFQKLWTKRKGPVARIVSARPLPLSVQSQLKERVREKGFSPEMEINPEVIGGLAIFFGDEYVVDGTVRAKLAKVQQALSPKSTQKV